MAKKIIFFLLICSTSILKSQILISLLFGDKLNKPGLEFGIDGGANYSKIEGLNNGRAKPTFNLGFYFHIALKNPSWMINTGLIVKSTLGATGLPVYSLNDAALDSAFTGGSVSTEIGYFSLPIMLRYKLKWGFCFDLGTQFGLLTKVKDDFSNSINSGELNYVTKTRIGYQPLDAGITGGLGYQFPTIGGMHFAIRYYYGLVNISQSNTGPKQYNRSFYLTAGLPIGLAKAKKENEAKMKNAE